MAIRYDQIELSTTSHAENPTVSADSNYVKLETQYGYILLGPGNSSHCHISTDLSNFYFNKEIRVNSGIIGSYDEDLKLRRAGTDKIVAGVNNIYVKESTIIQESWGEGDHNEQLTIQGNYPSMAFRNDSSDHKWLFHHDGNAKDFQFYEGNDWDSNVWTRRFALKNSGEFEITKASGTLIATGAAADAFGYNSSYGHYIQGNGGTYIYGNGSFHDGSANRTLIHSGNIGSQSVSYASNAGTLDNIDSTGFARRVAGTVTLTQNSYVRAVRVDGDNLASVIRMSVNGTTGSVVINALLDISVNHSGDIIVHSQAGNYTSMDVKIISNNNEDFDIYLQYTSGSGTTCTAYIEVFPLNSETITINPTATAHSGTTFIHTASAGQIKWGQSGQSPNIYLGGNKVYHAGNDGSGSGLDADTLDGVQGSSFVRSDADNTITGDLLINTGATQNGIRFRTTTGDFVGRYSNYVSLYNQTSGGEIRMYDTDYIILDSPDIRLGNGNGNTTRVNDILHVGASDSGNASIIFGEDSSNWYGAHLYWDSGYRFSWKTRNAGTDTDLFYYDTNDLSYIHWNRHHHIHNKDINYVNQLHFNANVRFYDDSNDSYLNFKYGDTNEGAIRFWNGSGVVKGWIYADNSGFGLLDNDGNWAVRTQTGTSPLELRCDNNAEFFVYNSYTYSPGSSRAPIFYDSDNTGYYIDPASTSVTNTMQAIDFQSTSRQAAPRWDTAFYVLQAQHWYGDNSTQTMYIGEDNYIHLRDNVEITDDVRSPIYYDRNDTGYYVDPASTSNMNVVTSANDVVDDEVLFAVTDYDTTESLRLKFGGTAVTKIDDPDAPASGVFKVAGSFNPTMGPFMPMDNETEVIFECWAKHDSGSDTAGLFYAGSNFYDGNKSYYGNTARYWGASSDAQDANDTGWRHIKGAFNGANIRASLSDASFFRFIVLFNYQASGNTTRFCGFKFYRSKKTVSSLRVKRGVNDTGFQSTEAATSHQVIDNNGNVTPYDAISMPYYNGGTMYFRKNSHWDNVSGIDAIGAAGEFRFSSNTGNLNVRTDGWLIAHDYVQSLNQVYGTIYYDQNNTGYYVDPSSTSKIYNLELISAKHTYLYINPGNGYEAMVRFNGGSGSTWYVGSRTSSQLLGTTDAYHVYSQTAGQTVGGYDYAGNHIALTSSRSPIFYDNNNTGYYLDPNSTSRLENLVVTHFGLANTSQTTRDGISLYGGYSSGEPTYGLLFTGTSLGTHGSVTGSWATYFTMNNDNSRGWIFRRVGSGNCASISGGGTASFNGDVIAYYSDMRLKTKLGDIEDPIGKIQALNGFYYEPNEIAESYGYEKETRVGLSAQEVEAILPEIVTDAPIGDGYKTVDYAKLVPVLVEAIKEQQQQIEELKTLINKS